MRGCERARRSDAGFVTAEAAVVLPVLVAFTTALVWALFVVAAQIKCVDAARTGARAAARQDPADAVVAVTREAAPHGAKVTVAREGDRVRVMVVARPPALGGLPFELREEAVAVAEDTLGETREAAQDSARGPAGVRSPEAARESEQEVAQVRTTGEGAEPRQRSAASRGQGEVPGPGQGSREPGQGPVSRREGEVKP